jgi:meiotically up-regulated gene 157 (Mug157) protein
MMHAVSKLVAPTLVRWILFLLCSALACVQTAHAADSYVSQRPPVAQRKFQSEAVEQVIAQVKSSIADPKLAWMFENCYPNTLDTTVDFGTRDGKPDTFVITGDIDAMWLRDSSAQVEGYLSLCREDAHLAAMIAGLIHRQSACILLDPYANAFSKDGSRVSMWHNDHTLMKPGVHERKWELDSLCYCIRLDYQYWKVTGDLSVFDDEWNRAMHVAVATMIDQQRKDGRGSYSFMRDNNGEINTQANGGYGAPFKPVGMICSAFRNSDDATTYLFNIPDNLFAVVSLRQLAEILDALSDRSGLAARSRALAAEVEAAVNQYGIIDDPWGDGKMYVYECDGLGHDLIIDDAGIPSLTTLPYLGCVPLRDPIYQNSRRFAQSLHNPLFYRGAAAEGTGSTHISGRNIWPMGIIGRALTSTDNAEILHCLAMLETSQADTGFMHESFNADNPQRFTRKWFAWVNNLFGVLVLKVERERPQLLARPAGK